MARAKIYYAVADIVWAKQHDKRCNFLLVFDKETAKKIAQDFKELGLVPFEKDKENENAYTLFAKEWNDNADKDKGTYKMKLLIREGSAQYPTPEVVIQEKTIIATKATDDEVVGTMDFISQTPTAPTPQPQMPQMQQPQNQDDYGDLPF